ncbi:hypothetical protein I5907_14065 [Panacibacter sp. DH6]|uniref:Uncharacterized protein n=1 Tax=Panacibacter microcysteis TaxID=2793269 RepID=A0A931EAN1_9BACT|nr:hypothetical protein [Panacibacter microcysteis]MBG9377364.1 hypothetical protein [Panacibacter microcysteis]
MAKMWLNAKRQIIKADTGWNDLASKNDAGFLRAENIEGVPFLSFIKGDPVRMFLDSIITRVLITNKPYILNYRCDAPATAQFMRMIVKKESDDVVSIEHDLINHGKISPSILFTENQTAHEQRCAICGKVEFKNEWHDALTNRKVFGTIHEMETKSVICPSCQEKVVQPLSEEATV